MRSLMHPLKPEFTFAGFTFPRYVATLPRGSFAKRIAHARESCCGPYYGAPKPNSTGEISFYLASDFAPGLRWQWCDEVSGVRIRHTGWHSDDDGIGEGIRGIVLRLPRSRGFLAGWSMGEGMASSIRRAIFATEAEAAHAADAFAEVTAEAEREYQREERERIDAEEAQEAADLAQAESD